MSKSILLTCVTGFIAKKIAADLLNAGHSVRGSLRSMKRTQEVNAAVASQLKNPASLSRLSFTELDLTKDAGWRDAMAGVDAVIHTASPFPGAAPKDENELIRPAVDGTLQALRAAQTAGVKRVVLTSSMVAIMHKDLNAGATLGADDWSTIDHPTMGAYAKSKTLAEQAAWSFVAEHPEMQLTTINPGLVLGTPTDANYGTSLDLISQFLTGKYPMIPNFGLPIVDLADVSTAHVRALDINASIGKRFVLADSYMMAPAMVDVLKTKHADKKLPKRIAPKFMVRLLSLFDAQIKAILPIIDLELNIDNSQTRDILDIDFTPSHDAIIAAAEAVSKPVKPL